jgi:type IV secretory pathway TrbD component
MNEESAAVALELSGMIGDATPPAPITLLESARRAALERSIVARRALEAALLNSASRAAVARASNGVFLVVVGRQAQSWIAGAFPLAMAVDEARSTPVAIKAQTLAGCSEALYRGGVCTATEAR